MNSFQIIAKPHPLRTETVVCDVPVGQSIAEVLGDADDGVKVAVEGEFISREEWEQIRPVAGTQIQVVRFPQGDGARKIVGVLLLVVIAIYAPYLLPYLTSAMGTVWGTVAYIAIVMLATMAAYALIPPPEVPKPPDANSNDFNRLNAITGTSNQAVPYGTIPMVIGESRYYPTFAANPYTEIVGDQQYLRMLLDLGYGDLQVSDLMIGETPLSSFDDVQWEITNTPTLFTDDIFELSLADAFNPGAVVDKTTQTLTDEVSIDVVFNAGLYWVNDKGDTKLATTTFRIQTRKVGSTDWIDVAGMPNVSISTKEASVFGNLFRVTSSERKMLRVGIRWSVPSGRAQYDVKMTRMDTTYSGASGAPKIKFDNAGIGALRSIKHTNPSKTGTTKLALRIKATDQLNGVINQLSVLGQQKIRVYRDGHWSAPETNYNPAWVYHWLLTDCPGVAQTVSDDRVDLARLVEWAADCDARGFTCKGMIDKAIASGDLYKMVLSAGRAAFAMRDGKYSCIFDKSSPIPVQHFSPKNSKDFSGQRTFVEVVHGLRVRFQNPALNWQEDEIIVLDDGYSYNGLDARGNPSTLPAATKFETLTCPYVTEPEALWQIARYHIAQAKFRPNVYKWTADVENLICLRGDLVYMAHDVTRWGAGFGHIVGVTKDGSNNVVSIEGAEPFIPEAGITYSIRVRDSSNNSQLIPLATLTPGVETNIFTLQTATPLNIGTGDLYLIGSTVSQIKQILVTKIEPGADLSASLTGVEYSSDIYAYSENPPTSYISAISGTNILEPPPPPRLYAAFSDPAAQPVDSSGSYDTGVYVGIQPDKGYYGGTVGRERYKSIMAY